MAYNPPRKVVNKSKKESDDKFLTVGKLSLWTVPSDYPSHSTIATGTMDLFLDGDEEHPIKVRVYLHKGKKKTDKSPDYYGFAKTTERLFNDILEGDEQLKRYKDEGITHKPPKNQEERSWDDDEIPFE